MKAVAMGALQVSRKTVKVPVGDDVILPGQSQTPLAVRRRAATRAGAGLPTLVTPGYRAVAIAGWMGAVETLVLRSTVDTGGTERGTAERQWKAELKGAWPSTGVPTAGPGEETEGCSR
jgi:hypothetical protein